MFMVTFGTKVFNYKTFSETSYTLILALLGDADLSELREANWYAGPIFFFLYVCIQVFVVLNMVIAIISDAYAEAEELLKKKRDYNLIGELYTYITNKCLFKTPCCGRKLRYYLSNSKVAKRARKLQKREKSMKKLYSKPLTKSPSSRALLNQMRIRRASIMELNSNIDEDETAVKRAATLGSIRDDTGAELIRSLQSKVEDNSAALISIKEQLSQVSLQLAMLIKQQQIGTVPASMGQGGLSPSTSGLMSPSDPKLLD